MVGQPTPQSGAFDLISSGASKPMVDGHRFAARLSASGTYRNP